MSSGVLSGRSAGFPSVFAGDGLGKVLARFDWRPLASFAVILAVWQLAGMLHLVEERVLPTPSAIIARGWHELADGDLGTDVAVSLGRYLVGSAIGTVSGLLIGTMLGVSRLASRLVGPTLLAQRQTALFAWVPLLAMWFGGNDPGKIAFIAVAAFQPMLVNSWSGIADIPLPYRELAATLLFSPLDYFRLIALPAALPALFTGLTSALNYAWLASVGSEVFLNIAPGLGSRLTEAGQLLDMELMILCIVLLGLIGSGFSLATRGIEYLLLKGRGK